MKIRGCGVFFYLRLEQDRPQDRVRDEDQIVSKMIHKNEGDKRGSGKENP